MLFKLDCYRFVNINFDAGGNSGIISAKNYSMNEVQEKYMTVRDYAKKHDVTIKTVYNWIESGRIPKDGIKRVLNVTLVRV